MKPEEFSLIRDILSGRVSITEIGEIVSGIDMHKLMIHGCRLLENSTATDEPLVLALLDYVATRNFASLAVVLDEEASRIDAELDRLVTDDEVLAAGFDFRGAFGRTDAIATRTPVTLVTRSYEPGWTIEGTRIKVTRRILAAITHR